MLSLIATYKINSIKAEKVNNKIISLYEKYNGKCETNSNCYEEIINYSKQIGYNATTFKINSKDYQCLNGYCYKENNLEKNEVNYEIITSININVPIISEIFSKDAAFQIKKVTNKIVLEGDK